jgi:predicted ATP-grasp superfamily ATP-dependent carboligase
MIVCSTVPADLARTPAVVLNSGPAGLAAVRSLGRARVPVLDIDFNSGPASRSKYCTFRLCPHPGTEPDAAVELLIKEASRFGSRPVLFPASDNFFELVSTHRDRLKSHFLMALPAAEDSAAMLDKRSQYEITQRAGIDCAATVYPETEADVDRAATVIDYPAFIKPHEGHLWRRYFGNKGFVVNSPDEMRARCVEILPKGVKFMVQSFILGPASNTYSAALYIDARGDCLGSFTARKLRQFPVDAGVGTLVESVDRPDVAGLGLKVCRALRYHGIAEVEFKQDDRDGKLKLIELNPRLWVQASLPSATGIDFTIIQFLDLLGHIPAPVATFRPGVRWLDWWSDYQACRALRRRGQVSALSPLSPLAEWARTRAFAIFAADDLRPFIANSQERLRARFRS